jgi:uncharacterized protein
VTAASAAGVFANHSAVTQNELQQNLQSPVQAGEPRGVDRVRPEDLTKKLFTEPGCRVDRYIREMSSRAELTIVVVVAFGWFMFASVVALFSSRTSQPISEVGLRGLLVYELVLLVFLGFFLRLRGWSFARLGLAPTLRDTAVGVVLAIAAEAAFYAMWYLFGWSAPGAGETAQRLVAPNLTIATVLTVSVVNALFEEMFVCGYIVTALSKTRSVLFAVNMSIAIRASYHLYQGALGVITIVPIGLLFAHWYAGTRRLWPLVVAHALIDILSLSFYIGAAR